MQITLIFYAALEEAISGEPMLLEVAEGSTAEQVIEQLSHRFPQAAPILKAIKRVEPIAVFTPPHFIITKELNFTLKYEKKYLDKYYY